MLKYLRIAVTALSLTACVLLSVLWVRSYWWWDTVNGVLVQGTPSLAMMSFRGQLYVILLSGNFPSGWAFSTVETSELGPAGVLVTRSHPTFGIAPNAFWRSSTPHWIFVVVFASAAVVPWMRWRFSLRTLLIATTLIAVGLSIVVAMS